MGLDRCIYCKHKLWDCRCGPGKINSMPQEQMPRIPVLARLKSGRFIRLDHVIATDSEHGRTLCAMTGGTSAQFIGEDAQDVNELLTMISGIAPAPTQPPIAVPDMRIVTP